MLDFHSHRLGGIHAYNPDEAKEAILSPVAAIGVHPWQSASPEVEKWLSELPALLSRPEVVALGEVGIDPNRGAPLQQQIALAQHQLRLASEMELPAIIHAVKSYHLILQLFDRIHPSRPWAMHAYNGRSQVTAEMARRCIFMSAGPRSSDASIASIPEHLLLAETDAYPADPITIEDIIDRIAAIRRSTPAHITDIVAANLARFLNS